MTKERREEFINEESRYKGPNRVIIALFFLIATIGVTTFIIVNKPVTTVSKRWEGGNYNIGKNRDYQGRVVRMTTIPNQVSPGEIRFPLEEVMQKELVYSIYKNPKGEEISFLAYISPAGRLVTAFGICEPCRSLSFHMTSNLLICDTCGTKWLLNDLSGISGGCILYPPEEIPYEVREGEIILDEKMINSWQPRK